MRNGRTSAWKGVRPTLQLAIVGLALTAGLGLRQLVRPEQPDSDAIAVPPAPPAPATPRTDRNPEVTAASSGEPAADSPWRARNRRFLELVHRINRARTEQEFLDLIAAVYRMPESLDFLNLFPVPLIPVIFERWSKIDPDAATRGISAVAHRFDLTDAMRPIVRLRIARHGADAITGLRGLPGAIGIHGPELALALLAESDPLAAMEVHGAAFPDDPESGLRAIFRTWSQKDPEGLASWIRSGLAGSERIRDPKLEAALLALAQRRPETTWELSASLPEKSGLRKLARIEALEAWLVGDAAAALGAIRSVSSGAERRELFRVAGAITNHQAAPPRDEWLRIIDPEESRQDFLAGAASALARGNGRPESFRTAVEISRDLTNPASRHFILGEIGKYWAATDAPDASRWLDAQPPGPDRDAVIGEFVREVVKADPAAALEWSAAIADPAKRMRRLEELLPKWVVADAGAAGVWVNESPALDPAERARLQRILEETEGP